MTNRERLNNMTDEDYAHWLCHQLWEDYDADDVINVIRYNQVRNFLKMEYKENDTRRSNRLLQSRLDLIKKDYPDIADYAEALEMAIEALNQFAEDSKKEKRTIKRTETHSCDLIDRQAAINELMDWVEKEEKKSWSTFKGMFHWTGIKAMIECLPSAQPEIIRCTECKHYREYDSKYVENAVVVQCMADRYPISETIPDGWFCAGAERKDDE